MTSAEMGLFHAVENEFKIIPYHPAKNTDLGFLITLAMEGFSKGGVPSFSPASEGSFACSKFFLRKWNRNPYVFLKSWSSRSFFICR